MNPSMALFVLIFFVTVHDSHGYDYSIFTPTCAMPFLKKFSNLISPFITPEEMGMAFYFTNGYTYTEGPTMAALRFSRQLTFPITENRTREEAYDKMVAAYKKKVGDAEYARLEKKMPLAYQNAFGNKTLLAMQKVEPIYRDMKLGKINATYGCTQIYKVYTNNLAKPQWFISVLKQLKKELGPKDYKKYINAFTGFLRFKKYAKYV